MSPKTISPDIYNSSHFGKVRGLEVEELVNQIVERLTPLLDRLNRMMLRNLKSLKAWQQLPTPNVSVGSAGQVNMAAQQVNVAPNEKPKGADRTLAPEPSTVPRNCPKPAVSSRLCAGRREARRKPP